MSERPTPTWTPPGGAFWADEWQPLGASLDVLDPEDGTTVGTVSDCSAADVDVAVTGVSRSVLDGADWPVWQRREALHRVAVLLGERREVFAELMSREGCKPVRDAEREVLRAVETVRLSAEQAHRLQGHTLAFDDTPRGEGRIGWYTREPVGVIGAITPFNDPLNLVAHKLGPALIAGNGVVLKPAEHTALTALAFIDLLLEAGVPTGRIAVLPGRGPTVGAALVGHPLVDMVSFTGGYDTGNAVARAAGAKKTLMELGGNGAVIVLPDADVERAAAAVVDGAFGAAGQNCLSVQRVFAAPALLDRLLDLVVRAHRAPCRRQQGQPRNRSGAADRRGRRGTRRDLGGRGSRGRRHGPHRGQARRRILLAHGVTGVPAGARVLSDEVFGPVVSIEAYGSVDSAVAEVNRSSTAYRPACSPATSTPPSTWPSGCA